MFNAKKNHNQHMNIDTLVGESCVIEGDIRSQNSLKIEGGIHGNVGSEGLVIVGEKGWIKGNIQARELLVFGRIEGDIVAQNLDLKASAHLAGNIDTHTLQVEPGAVYQGSVSMHSPQDKALPDHGAATKALPAGDA